MKRLRVLLALTLLTPALAAAPAPLMTVAGAALLSDPLTALTTEWKAAKGQWAVTDGVLQGKSVAAENHAATYRHALAFRDGVIRFDVRLDTAKSVSLSVNDAGGHAARVTLDARGFQARKDDHDHAGPDQAMTFGAVKVPLVAGTWHTVTVEFLGDRILASVDGQAAPGTLSFGRAELIGTAKTNVGVTVSGGAASFQNFGVWAATANAAWVDPAPVVKAKK